MSAPSTARSVAGAALFALLTSCGDGGNHAAGETGGAIADAQHASGGAGAGGVAGGPGGTSALGGVATGGRPQTGGATTGGAVASAGATATGGSTSGGVGAIATGGSSSGGVGAIATGGSSNSGGASSGGGNGGSGGTAAKRPFKGVANSPCAARTALDVSWYYNWTERETEACSDGRGGEFVPMIWGHTGDEQSATGIASALTSFAGKGYRYVLGFNEPDNSTQSNITVMAAISLLPAFGNAALLVGTPATQANTSGQTWFKDFMGQVNASTSLRADFIAIHWYGWNTGSCDAKASQLESYIKYAEGFAGNRPIWLTEWGCLNESAPTAQGVADFYQGALAVFAKHPRVERYAFYPWSTNNGLTNSDGSLTPLGVAYAAAPAYH